MMDDHWESIGEITKRILSKNAPVTFEVPIERELALAISLHAKSEGVRPETIIAAAARNYMGADA